MKTLWDTMWFPLLLFFGFCLCYALPFHAPAPHGLTVAVSGSVNASQQRLHADQRHRVLQLVLQLPDKCGRLHHPVLRGQPSGASGAFDVVPVQNDW